MVDNHGLVGTVLAWLCASSLVPCSGSEQGSGSGAGGSEVGSDAGTVVIEAGSAADAGTGVTEAGGSDEANETAEASAAADDGAATNEDAAVDGGASPVADGGEVGTEASSGGSDGGPACPAVSDGTSTWCATAFAQNHFARGVCACTAIFSQGPVDIGGMADGAAGSFGTNGDWTLSGAYGARVNGPVTVLQHLDTSGTIDIGGDLRGWSIGSAGATSVHGDTYVAGLLTYFGIGNKFTCDGFVFTPTKNTNGTPWDAYVPGDLGVGHPDQYQLCTATDPVKPCVERSGPITIDPPCACDTATPSAIIEHHVAVNDDATVGLDAGAFMNVGDAGALQLPSGVFYLNGLAGTGSLTIGVAGRTVLVLGSGATTAAGDPASIALDHGLSFDVAQGAELDLFLAATWVKPTDVPAVIGNPDWPSGLRIYSMATDFWPLGASEIAGHVFLPRANLSVAIGTYGELMPTPIDVTGSLVIGSLTHYGTLTVRDGTGALRALGAN